MQTFAAQFLSGSTETHLRGGNRFYSRCVCWSFLVSNIVKINQQKLNVAKVNVAEWRPVFLDHGVVCLKSTEFFRGRLHFLAFPAKWLYTVVARMASLLNSLKRCIRHWSAYDELHSSLKGPLEISCNCRNTRRMQTSALAGHLVYFQVQYDIVLNCHVSNQNQITFITFWQPWGWISNTLTLDTQSYKI